MLGDGEYKLFIYFDNYFHSFYPVIKNCFAQTDIASELKWNNINVLLDTRQHPKNISKEWVVRNKVCMYMRHTVFIYLRNMTNWLNTEMKLL